MTLRSSFNAIIGSACIATIGLAVPAFAQQAGGFSQLDVRPSDATASLNASLTRLGDNPRDVGALIGAGEAALSLNDPNAATGFFARADEIQSGNGRIKAGLGRAMLQLQNATEALRLFDQAERLRYPVDSFIGDRALARDLTGDQAGAQRDYQVALRAKPNDAELLRRYSISLGISGQVDASEKVIEPLLYKNDRAAWRNRAFVLAMNGREQQARTITQTVMPKPLADAIQPYMDRMAGLTPAQRAAAVHFGNFPATAGVRIASNNVAVPKTVQPVPSATPRRQVQEAPSAPVGNMTVRQPAPSQPASSGSALASGPLGPSARSVAPPGRTDRPVIQQGAPVMPVQANPVPVRPAPPAASPEPAPSAPVQRRVLPSPGSNAVVQGPIDPAPAPQAASRSQQTPMQPAISATPAASGAVDSPTPNPVATRTLADIMRELNVPDSERRTQVAAVDVSELVALQEKKRQAARAAAEKAKRDAAAKVKAEADAKAKALAAEKAKLAKNPSRNWVQVGTGQNISALGFTLRGLRKKYDSLSGQSGYTAAWGRTNRLVVGPFSSFAKAKDLEATMKRAGADVFAWQSEAGEEVVPLASN
ncbi:MAG: SPOR domain-containing protein [Sphingobium sp.]|uniref:tetratricopeptide repeat protein n=1 Tax=Sphingobium sp. TaxID=1912891 RepID=UPI0029A1F220|nr:SPOR domain-containing protein [Sphingobium sp.]MDX3908666.1 SPOR domain-containing protein [Sphingobium sp.]